MYLSFASPRVDPRGTRGYTGGMVQYWYFFFFRDGGEGELFSFGNDFAGPWGHTYGLGSRQCDRQGDLLATTLDVL